jgi:hypothetical protein
MRHANHLVFDEFIPKETEGTNPVHTGTQHNAQLARFSQLGIQVVADNSSGSGALKLQIEESCDGRNWLPRNPGTPQISTDAMNSAPTVTDAWASAFQGQGMVEGPLLGFVRFKIFFDNATTSAHVKVYVTQRGQHS